jgi:hypothetical protein
VLVGVGATGAGVEALAVSDTVGGAAVAGAGGLGEVGTGGEGRCGTELSSTGAVLTLTPHTPQKEQSAGMRS